MFRPAFSTVFSVNLKRQDTPLLNISDPFLAETVEYWSTLNYSEDNLNFPPPRFG